VISSSFAGMQGSFADGYTGLTCGYIGLICGYIWLICGCIGLICGYIGLICGYIGFFGGCAELVEYLFDYQAQTCDFFSFADIQGSVADRYTWLCCR